MKNIFLFIMIFMCSVVSEKGYAQNKQFIGTSNHDWHNPANWNPYGVPNSSTTVEIAGNVAVNIGDSAYAREIVIAAGGTSPGLNVSSHLEISGATGQPSFWIYGGTVNVTPEGSIRILQCDPAYDCMANSGGVVTNQGLIEMPNCVYGINIGHFEEYSSIINTGVIRINSVDSIESPLVVSTNGEFKNESCGLLELVGNFNPDPYNLFEGSVVNNGVILLNQVVPIASLPTVNNSNGILYDYNNTLASTSGLHIISYRHHYWTGCTSSDWDDPLNWSQLLIPSVGDTVIIPESANDPVLSTNSDSLAFVSILANAELTIKNGGTLRIDRTGLPAISSGIDLHGKLSIASTADSVIITNVNARGITSSPGSNLINFGTIRIDQTTANTGILSSGLVDNHGAIYITGPDTGLIILDSFFNSGNVALTGNVSHSIWTNGGVFINEVCGYLSTIDPFYEFHGYNFGLINYLATTNVNPDFYYDEGFQWDPNSLLFDDSYTYNTPSQLSFGEFRDPSINVSCHCAVEYVNNPFPNGIIYVDDDATGSNNGSSWTNAFTDLQTALNKVYCGAGATIYVAAGIYRPSSSCSGPGNLHKTFGIEHDLQIYGGFAGTESDPGQRPMVDGKPNPAYYSILSGDLGQNDSNVDGNFISEFATDIVSDSSGLDNVFHVVTMAGVSNATIFDGFVITGGSANGSDRTTGEGGGLFNDGLTQECNPIIKNCLFSGNAASVRGGAVFNAGNTAPHFINCQFVGNVSYQDGGAIYTMADPVALEVSGLFNGHPYFKNCRFAGNSSSQKGACLYNNGTNGGLVNTTLLSCVISGNLAEQSSGGILVDAANSESTIINSTFANNKGGVFLHLANGESKLYNSIVYKNELNTSSGSVFSGSNYDIQNCIIDGITPSGTNIENIDPQFVNLIPLIAPVPNTNGDYRLQSCSPAIDKGDNVHYLSETNDTLDFDGNSRLLNGYLASTTQDPNVQLIDLGPFEEQTNPIRFTATKNLNDAYIDLFWRVNKHTCSCFTEDPVLEQGVTVQLKSGNDLIEYWEVYEETIDSVYEINYRDYVGPNMTKDYILEFKRTGPATLNCRQVVQGSTLPFIAPTMDSIYNEVRPDSIRIKWTNHSSLTSGYNIYRDSELIGSVDATDEDEVTYTFDDVFRFNDTTSLINGSPYNYCIETVSGIYKSLYGTDVPHQLCQSGASTPIQLTASDNAFVDKVSLNWLDMSGYADLIQIVRNGELIASLPAEETSYDDVEPIYGRNSLYGVELLKENNRFVGAYDFGQNPPNGIISGRVLTNNQKTPVKGVVIQTVVQQNGLLDTIKTTTNFNGEFEFTDVFYNTSSEFLLTAADGDTIFETNPLTCQLMLSDPISTYNIFLMDTVLADNGPGLTTVTNFSATPLPDQDLVGVVLDYQGVEADTTFFNFYRGSDLIAQHTDVVGLASNTFQFVDSTGIPGRAYEYTVHAFKITSQGLMDTLLNDTTIYPLVAPVTSLSESVISSLGKVDFAWTHSSMNSDGFRLYRDGYVVYEGLNYNYSDISGEPGKSTNYHITSIRKVDGVIYESIPDDTIHLTYPDLTPINSISYLAIQERDILRLDITIPNIYVADYAYGGINIYREDTVRLATYSKALLQPGQTLSFEDRTGIPGHQYDYEVRPYKMIGNEIFELSSMPITANFPLVSLADNLSGSKKAGYIQLNWSKPHTSDNYHGFIIYRGTGPIDSIGEVEVTFNNEFKDLNPANSGNTYHIRTVRCLNGQRYLSDLVSKSIGAPLPVDDDPFLVNFTATTDVVNHIKLCWEYNEPANQTDFHVYREGNLIATLPYTSRSYYDYDAPAQKDVFYEVEKASGAERAIGFRPARKTVSGRVAKLTSNRGLAEIPLRIQINKIDGGSTPIFTSLAQTNESGYYLSENLPDLKGQGTHELIVEALSNHARFLENPVSHTILNMDSTKNFVLNIWDTIPSVSQDGSVSALLAAGAESDPANMRINLSWSPENDTYDGFVIYKGVDSVTQVLAGSPLLWSDYDGLPGVPTIYSVRAFKLYFGGRVYSNRVFASAEFPKLQPVEHLSATEIPSKNKVEIQWSHPYDNHDYYAITRNGESFHVIPCGRTLLVIDSTGIPGKSYTYEVKAYAGIVPSIGKSVSISFPAMEPIRNFVLDSLDGQHNYLELTWTYETGAADEFQIIRYLADGLKTDEQVIARLDGIERTYKDYSGVPNVSYTYEIVPSRLVNEVSYYAPRRDAWSETMLFPRISNPSFFYAHFESGYIYFLTNIPHLGVDGLEIYRGTSPNFLPDASNRILTEEDGRVGDRFVYRDSTGIPLASYFYKIRLVKNKWGTDYYSNSMSSSGQYPRPTAPENLEASDGLFTNKISLEWTYDALDPVTNFEIYRSADGVNYSYLATVTGGERTHDDFVDFSVPPQGLTTVYYYIKAVNHNISSDSVTDEGYIYAGVVIGNEGNRMGRDVDISGEWAAAGTNGHGVYVYRLQDDNSWTVHQYLDPANISGLSASDGFGYAISLSGKYLAVSAFAKNSGQGEVYVYERSQNEEWNLHSTIQSNTPLVNESFGINLDVYDNLGFGGLDVLAVSSLGASGNGKLYVFERSGSTWVLKTSISGNYSGLFLGMHLSVYDERIVATDHDFIRLFSRTGSGNWINSDNELFNSQFDFASGLGLFQDSVVVGSSLDNDVIAYSIAGGLFNSFDVICGSHGQNPRVAIHEDHIITGYESGTAIYYCNGNMSTPITGPSQPAQPGFGRAVAVSNRFYMVGHPYFDNFSGAVTFIPIESVDPPQNVSATDGTNAGQVTISWDEPVSGTASIDGYNIYREGQFLTNVSTTQGRSYADLPSTGLIPGKVYTYQVESTNGIHASVSIGDKGHMPANGMVSGTVKTLVGSAPIENAEVTASIVVDGDQFSYTTMTDHLGEYSFDDLYYGEEAEIFLRCSYLNHEIISQESAVADPQLTYIIKTLTVNTNVLNELNFVDKTAYAVQGLVRHHKIDNCFMDSVSVTRTYSTYENGVRTRLKETKITDENGAFTFVVNPELAGLDSLLFSAADIQPNGGDSVDIDLYALSDNPLFNISADNKTVFITDNFNLDLISEIEFRDAVNYDFEISVTNTCGEALSLGSTWTVKAQSIDGCYEALFKLDSATNSAYLNLPPKNMRFTVYDVDNKSLENLAYLDFLVNNPVDFDLFAFHRDSVANMNGGQIQQALKARLEYHKPPVFTVELPMDSFICGTDIPILSSGVQYTVSVEVHELFSSPCHVKSGFVRVVNDAATRETNVDTLYLNQDDEFDDYIFVADVPNPVAPYTWNISFEYFSPTGIFQRRTSAALFVDGSITLPGNGILPDATVPMPLYVLRDPPGDRSFSRVDVGHQVTKTWTFEDGIGGSAGPYAEGVLRVLGYGLAADFDVQFGRYNESNRELSLATEVTHAFETEGTPNEGNSEKSKFHIGRGAGVIVGAGLAMQYGLINNIGYDPTNCQVSSSYSIGITPVRLSTTWTYTVRFIEGLIKDLVQDSIAIENGSLVIDGLGTSTDPQIIKQNSLTRISSIANNWRNVIRYYDRETNPIIQTTAGNFESDAYKNDKGEMLESSEGSLNEEANKWSNRLKQDMPKLANDPTKVDPTTILNNQQLAKYNNAAIAIRELMSLRSFNSDDFGTEGEFELILDDYYDTWHFTEDRYIDTDYSESELEASENNMAENRTFSGLTTQEHSIEESKSLVSESSWEFYINAEFFVGLAFGENIKVFGKEVLKADSKIGVRAHVNYSTKETTAVEVGETAKVSYVLSDDDPFDQVSVSIFNSTGLNETPYFQTVGGQTGCPYEQGTLPMNVPVVQVLDPDSGNPAKSASLYFQDPDIPAEFTVRLTNLSSAQTARSMQVFLDNTSNPNGAVVRIAGEILGTTNFVLMPFNDPTDLSFTVQRGSGYTFEDLLLVFRGACDGASVKDSIYLNVYFQSPCSPISIAKPDDQWLINGQSRDLVVGLRDYVPSTPNFEDLSLEYRRLNNGVLGFTSGWKTIPFTSIKESGDKNNPVTPDILDAYNVANYLPGQTPTYFMVWEPDMGNASAFPDGQFELRAKTKCTEGLITNFTYSNVVTGRIDRSRLQLFGYPEPSDGIYVPGDQISASFNKDINCINFQNQHFLDTYLKAYVDGQLVTNATFTCFNNEIRMTVPDMSIYDGKMMTVSVDSISDPNGNLAFDLDGVTRKIEWSFRVSTNKAFWEQDSIIVEIYEGETTEFTAGIISNEFQVQLTNLNISGSTASNPWLDLDPNGNFNINPGGIRPVVLTFTGVTPGVTYDTLSLNNLPGNGTTPRLPIKLITRKRPIYPPNYQVNGGQYPNSMTLVTNFKFGNTGQLSTDSMDQITVWIDAEIRGIGRIEQVNPNEHVAYITIYGSSTDNGRPLEYRVWDADEGVEYNATAVQGMISYQDDAFIGTTANPIILVIDTLSDQVRYIHLNQGYTWISLNAEDPDMSINNIMSDVKNATPGDRILGQDGFAEYINDTVGWFAAPLANLDSFSTEQSYMVYLQNGPDSIRMTGADAAPFANFYTVGAHWIGFPSQESMPIEDAIGPTVNNSIINVSQLKSKDEARLSVGNTWSSGALTTMLPNQGHKIFFDGVTALTVPGTATLLQGPHAESVGIAADTTDPGTWQMSSADYTFEDVIPMVLRLYRGGSQVLGDPNKKIAVFIGDELHAVGSPEHLDKIDDDVFTLLIGKDAVDTGKSVRLFYADGSTVLDVLEIPLSNLEVNGSGIFTYLDPYVWSDGDCLDELVLTTADSPLNGLYFARQSISISGNVQILNGANVELRAPEVLLNGLDQLLGSELLINQTGCD